MKVNIRDGCTRTQWYKLLHIVYPLQYHFLLVVFVRYREHRCALGLAFCHSKTRALSIREIVADRIREHNTTVKFQFLISTSLRRCFAILKFEIKQRARDYFKDRSNAIRK